MVKDVGPLAEPRSPCAAAARRRGFTLLEGIVVLGVLGIAAVISVVALQQVAPRAKLAGAVGETDVLLKKMRLNAVRKQIEIEITLEDGAGATQSVATMLANADQPYFLVARKVGEPDPTLSLLDRVTLPTSRSPGVIDGILLRSITFPGEKIVFDRLGGVEETGSLIFGYHSGGEIVVREIKIENRAGKMSKVDYTAPITP